MKKLLFVYSCFLTIFLFVINSHGGAQAPVLNFSPLVSSGLTAPLDVVNAGDGTNRLFIVEQGGTVKIYAGGTLQVGNFLNIADTIVAGGERGLLSLAFHPAYSTNRYFFLYYNSENGDVTIARMQTKAANPNEADPLSLVVLLSIPKPFANHNGGKLNFGKDGNLYFATGDGGGGGDPNNNAQNGNSLLGKMIRINVDNFSTPPYYAIPADNPYLANAAVRDEIFAIGLRNPFRWSFDRLNNDVWIADVGQDAWEEVNQLSFATAAGVNYGWRCYEGNNSYNTAGCLPAANYTFPIFQYSHNNSTGGYSITGGYVYRGSAFPALYGYYVCADYVSANAWLIAASGGGVFTTSIQAGVPGTIVGFGEDENGELYAVALDGRLYRVGTSIVLPVLVQSFSATERQGFNELKWSVNADITIAGIEVDYSEDGLRFQKAGDAGAVNSNRSAHTFIHRINNFSTVFYRLKITGIDGRITYSSTVRLQKNNIKTTRVYPTVVTNNQLTIETGNTLHQLNLFTIDGKKVFENKFNNFTGTTNISIPKVASGFYIVQLITTQANLKFKVFIEQ